MRKAKKAKQSTKKRQSGTRKAASKAGKKGKTAARRRTGTAPRRSTTRRLSWLDEAKQTPLIEARARKLDFFVAAMTDGVVQKSELEEQEKRLVGLMKEIEPQLNDVLHSRVTELLCELTAYDIMHILHYLHATRPKTTFRG